MKPEEWLPILKAIDGIVLLLIYKGVNTFNDLYEKSKLVVRKNPYLFYTSLIVPDYDDEFIPTLHSLIVRELVRYKEGKFYITSKGEEVAKLILNSKLDELVESML